jgi:hypothetical protein
MKFSKSSLISSFDLCYPSSLDIGIDMTFELTNCEDKSIRELPCVNSGVPED